MTNKDRLTFEEDKEETEKVESELVFRELPYIVFPYSVIFHFQEICIY